MRVQLSLETRPVCSRAPEFRRAYSVCTRPAGEERRSLCTGRNYFWNNFKRIFCFLNTVEHHFLGSNTRIRSNIPMVCQRAGRAFRSLREIRLRIHFRAALEQYRQEAARSSNYATLSRFLTTTFHRVLIRNALFLSNRPLPNILLLSIFSSKFCSLTVSKRLAALHAISRKLNGHLLAPTASAYIVYQRSGGRLLGNPDTKSFEKIRKENAFVFQRN